ncbi:hypothetical protein LWI28_000557 [Acer negundo]|uniref:Pentatricopeptide repeat-containing protein n=1 Tax=Acer negundo TaxID=4023 RepID=A0AAD5JGJ3_ACENE|nr:hypothetical protein LWI28_000557 [Acer negundo]
MTTAKQALSLSESLHRSIFNGPNSTTASLSHTQQVHTHVLKTDAFEDSHVATKLLSQYANHIRFTDANQFLDSISEPAIFSFSALIYTYTKQRLFNQRSGCSLECSLLVSRRIVTYLKCNRIRDAHKLFDRLPQADVVIFSDLSLGYARQGCVDDVKKLFKNMEDSGAQPNLVSWNGIIAGLDHSRYYEEAIIMFQKMHFEGFISDRCSLSSVLSSVGDLESLNIGLQVHDHVIKQGLGQDKCVASSLIDMYGKCACPIDMSKVFVEVDALDIGACNALVTGLSRITRCGDEEIMMLSKYRLCVRRCGGARKRADLVWAHREVGSSAWAS